MKGKTFVEKIFKADAGSIVFKKPDLVLTHDNTSSIEGTFKKMNGKEVKDPNQLLVVLDHNAPPTNAKLANSYQQIRDFIKKQGIKKFHDVGYGICHQVVADYAKPGMVIVGSDSHTCTAGAFNAFAAGIDRTEAAGLWKQGETWFRVPETIKITLKGALPEGVYSKDLSLWIIGMISSSGADYQAIEYHGDGVKTLSISERMTIANLASEMGAKNAVFPFDNVLKEHLNNENLDGIWADKDAIYKKEITINLEELFPVIAVPHHVDNVKALKEVEGTPIHQAIIGTCTNGRLEDLLVAAHILKGKKVSPGVQMLVIPASRAIYLQALKEGLIEIFMNAGANVLSTSCGPCLGTGQGIPADGYRILSTANRNFKGRMGNKEAEIYLASPAVVAESAIKGYIAGTRKIDTEEVFPFTKEAANTIEIDSDDLRKNQNIWNYKDVDNLNTDQMFAGNLTYNVASSEPEKIMPYLFKGFDDNFAENVKQGDILIAGANFGCGSSREHPAVGLSHAGVKAVIVKSVNRIFYRSSVNQGLPIIILPEAVDEFQTGNHLELNLEQGFVKIEGRQFDFSPLPDKLMNIFKSKGLAKFLATQ